MSELRADWPAGTEVTVWTVGHGQGPLDGLVGALTTNRIDCVIDVRSRPFIKRAPHFSRPELEPALLDRGFGFEWLGEVLGQRPEGDEFYDEEGHALYERIAAQRWFLKGIARIEYLAAATRVCVLCVEEPPEQCHRYELLGKVLGERGATVLHIRRTGHIERQVDVMHRISAAQTSFFDEVATPWRSYKPMRGGHGVADLPEDEWEPP